MSQRKYRVFLILFLTIIYTTAATTSLSTDPPAPVSFSNVDMTDLLKSLNMSQADLQQMQNEITSNPNNYNSEGNPTSSNQSVVGRGVTVPIQSASGTKAVSAGISSNQNQGVTSLATGGDSSSNSTEDNPYQLMDLSSLQQQLGLIPTSSASSTASPVSTGRTGNITNTSNSKNLSTNPSVQASINNALIGDQNNSNSLGGSIIPLAPPISISTTNSNSQNSVMGLLDLTSLQQALGLLSTPNTTQNNKSNNTQNQTTKTTNNNKSSVSSTTNQTNINQKTSNISNNSSNTNKSIANTSSLSVANTINQFNPTQTPSALSNSKPNITQPSKQANSSATKTTSTNISSLTTPKSTNTSLDNQTATLLQNLADLQKLLDQLTAGNNKTTTQTTKNATNTTKVANNSNSISNQTSQSGSNNNISIQQISKNVSSQQSANNQSQIAENKGNIIQTDATSSTNTVQIGTTSPSSSSVTTSLNKNSPANSVQQPTSPLISQSNTSSINNISSVQEGSIKGSGSQQSNYPIDSNKSIETKIIDNSTANEVPVVNNVNTLTVDNSIYVNKSSSNNTDPTNIGQSFGGQSQGVQSTNEELNGIKPSETIGQTQPVKSVSNNSIGSSQTAGPGPQIFSTGVYLPNQNSQNTGSANPAPNGTSKTNSLTTADIPKTISDVTPSVSQFGTISSNNNVSGIYLNPVTNGSTTISPNNTINKTTTTVTIPQTTTTAAPVIITPIITIPTPQTPTIIIPAATIPLTPVASSSSLTINSTNTSATSTNTDSTEPISTSNTKHETVPASILPAPGLNTPGTYLPPIFTSPSVPATRTAVSQSNTKANVSVSEYQNWIGSSLAVYSFTASYKTFAPSFVLAINDRNLPALRSYLNSNYGNYLNYGILTSGFKLYNNYDDSIDYQLIFKTAYGTFNAYLNYNLNNGKIILKSLSLITTVILEIDTSNCMIIDPSQTFCKICNPGYRNFMGRCRQFDVNCLQYLTDECGACVSGRTPTKGQCVS